MGNRNLYHFCLAILIFLDITVPLSLAAIIILTRNANDKSILNKTLGLSTVSPPNSMTVETAAVTNPEAKIDVSASACCTTTVSIGTFVFGLLMFVTFVTIAGVLGQSSTIFCNGYVRSSCSLAREFTFLTIPMYSGIWTRNINSPAM
jgi:hypothetical protein